MCIRDRANIGEARIFAAGVSRHEDRLRCFAVLRQLRSIPRSVPRSVLQSLVTSLVLTRLDYGNANLAGIPLYLLKTSVGDELHCSADILIVAVRPHHSTSTPTALVEGKGAN